MAQSTNDQIIDDLLTQMYEVSKSGLGFNVERYLTKKYGHDTDYVNYNERIIQILEEEDLIEKSHNYTEFGITKRSVESEQQTKTLTHKAKSIVESGGWIKHQGLSSVGYFQRAKSVIVPNIPPAIIAIIVTVIGGILVALILHYFFGIG